MVSVYDIIQSQVSRFTHVTTGLGDHTPFEPGVYDFQTTPTNQGVAVAVASMIISHLSHASLARVVVIECLGRFPWQLVTKHRQFRGRWLDAGGPLRLFRCPSFGEVYTCLESVVGDENTLVVVYQLHELLDHYRLQLVSSFKHQMLKYKLEKTATAVDNKQQGIPLTQDLPTLPPQSDLLQKLAISKYDAHMAALVLLLQEVAATSVVVVTGGLDARFCKLETWSSTAATASSSQLPSLPISQSRDPVAPSRTRLMLVPSTETLYQHVAARFIFYRDWYQKTPQFALSSHYQPRVSYTDLRLVHAVKVDRRGQVNTYWFDLDVDDGATQHGQFKVTSLMVDTIDDADEALEVEDNEADEALPVEYNNEVEESSQTSDEGITNVTVDSAPPNPPLTPLVTYDNTNVTIRFRLTPPC